MCCSSVEEHCVAGGEGQENSFSFRNTTVTQAPVSSCTRGDYCALLSCHPVYETPFKLVYSGNICLIFLFFLHSRERNAFFTLNEILSYQASHRSAGLPFPIKDLVSGLLYPRQRPGQAGSSCKNTATSKRHLHHTRSPPKLSTASCTNRCAKHQ